MSFLSFLFRETADDDNRRTGALLDALDEASEAADPAHEEPLSPFEEVVLEGLACGPVCTGSPYPPAGHTYPRRG